MGHQFLNAHLSPSKPSAALRSVTKLIVLRGGNLGALTAETAAIETLTGCRQSVHAGAALHFPYSLKPDVTCKINPGSAALKGVAESRDTLTSRARVCTNALVPWPVAWPPRIACHAAGDIGRGLSVLCAPPLRLARQNYGIFNRSGHKKTMSFQPNPRSTTWQTVNREATAKRRSRKPTRTKRKAQRRPRHLH